MRTAQSRWGEYGARPEPLAVADVQALLRAEEALLLILDTPEWKPTPEETFIWVVTKTDMRGYPGLGTSSLRREVARCARADASFGRVATAKISASVLNNKHRYQLNIDSQDVDVLP
jgi:hypothetical protein